MTTTPNLALPYIDAAQAQKHVTHNEAIRGLDALVQTAIVTRTLSAPPATPADGACYILAAAGTSGWTGYTTGTVAAWQDGIWVFYAPKTGWLAWVIDEATTVTFNGTAWVVFGPNAGLPQLGVNTTADAVNKLAVKSPAVLFDNIGNGVQAKINKRAATDTASLLYQDNYSGRAEIGLAGDDNFHFKVSPDGATWKEALLLDRASGLATILGDPTAALGVATKQYVDAHAGGGGGRTVLAAARTYYVATTGSDANTGLAAGTPFLTIQAAINAVAAIDLSVYNVTIQLADGTYTGVVSVNAPFVGAGSVTLQGNLATPANVIVTSTNATLTVQNGAALTGSGVEVRASVYGFVVSTGGKILIGAAMRFGACASGHMVAQYGGLITAASGLTGYAVVGGAFAHIYVYTGGLVALVFLTVTAVAAPAFTYFAYFTRAGFAEYHGNTFGGTFGAGTRYYVTGNSVLFVNGAGANYLPGNAAGVTGTGGQYV